MKNRILLFIGLILITISSCSFAENEHKQPHPKAKNIILLIGDGMGMAQAYAAWTANKGHLCMFTFPVTGNSITYSANDYITDSGAGGTAIATGSKTKNGSIGVDSSGNTLKSILHYAEENGLATGLVSTSAITHATPASFIAHQVSRGSYEDIAADFLKTDIDVFIGGGIDHFTKRKDSIDLTKELAAKGYQITYSIEEASKVKTGKLAALTAPEHNPKIIEGRGNMLTDATDIALRLLSQSDKGFFIMIEGSQIDWGGHENNQEYVVSEVIDFDKAVAKALEFAKADKNTLVIVTADHETGGFTLQGGNIKEGQVKGVFSTPTHTATPVPVYAYGPGAELFAGIYENTELIKKMLQVYGFTK